MELKAVEIVKPAADINVVIGQSHFIKTVEDLYEAIVQAVPGWTLELGSASIAAAARRPVGRGMVATGRAGVIDSSLGPPGDDVTRSGA